MEPNSPPDENPGNVSTPLMFVIRHWLVLFASASITIWGLGGLMLQIYQIFIRYPAIFRTILTQHNSSLYILMLQQVFFISLTNCVASAYGLAMLIKPSRMVKFANIAVGVIIIMATYYFNKNYQITPEVISNLQLNFTP